MIVSEVVRRFFRIDRPLGDVVELVKSTSAQQGPLGSIIVFAFLFLEKIVRLKWWLDICFI